MKIDTENCFQCIPSDLFCDGTVNCALPTGHPLDEINCTTSEKGLTVPRNLIQNFLAAAYSKVLIILGIFIVLLLLIGKLFCVSVSRRNLTNATNSESTSKGNKMDFNFLHFLIYVF